MGVKSIYKLVLCIIKHLCGTYPGFGASRQELF